MAKIDVAQFLGKPKEYEIAGQKVLLEPLKGKDLDLLMGVKEGQEAAGVKKLIMASFDLTEVELEQLPVSFLNDAVVAILDVNGLKQK